MSSLICKCISSFGMQRCERHPKKTEVSNSGNKSEIEDRAEKELETGHYWYPPSVASQPSSTQASNYSISADPILQESCSFSLSNERQQCLKEKADTSTKDLADFTGILRMNSEDSLNQERRDREWNEVDTNQQGPDLAESPQESLSTSSGGGIREMKPQEQQQQQAFVPHQGQPIAPAMIFDSGHYYATSQPPHVIYQPVYYPAPAPAGLFYQATPHPATYYVTPSAQFVAGSPHMGYGPAPPSQNNGKSQQQKQQCYHCQQNTSSDSEVRSVHSEPYLKQTTNVCNVEHSAHGHHHHQEDKVQDKIQLEREEQQHSTLSHPYNPEYNPEPFTSSPELSVKTTNRYHQGANLEKEHGRTPLFGQNPTWWGAVKQKNAARDYENVQESKSAISMSSSELLKKSPSIDIAQIEDSTSSIVAGGNVGQIVSDSEAVRFRSSGNPDSQPVTDFNAGRRSFKPVRMDIDLSTAPVEAVQSEMLDKAPPRRALSAATAFTVTFDSEKESLSLQDAARRCTPVRRMMRKSLPPANHKHKQKQKCVSAERTPPSSHCVNVDPKQYLLNKFLHGDCAELPSPDDIEGSHEKDTDALSEAGTYIIESDGKRRLSSNLMSASFTLEEEEESRTPSPTNNNDAIIEEKTEIPDRESKEETTGSDCAQQRGHLLREVPKMGTEADNVKGKETVKKTKPCAKIAPARPVITATNRHLMPQPKLRPIYASKPSNFKREDGGRFSMRSESQQIRANRPSVHSTASSVAKTKPPFRTGSGRDSFSSRWSTDCAPLPVGTSKESSTSAEMAAWLRRKDYNPMKAVAEARKKNQQQFVSNRSMSFHLTEVNTVKTPFCPQLAKQQRQPVNKSHEDLRVQDWSSTDEIALSSDVDIRKTCHNVDSGSEDMEAISSATKRLSKQCDSMVKLIRNSGQLSPAVEKELSCLKQAKSKNESAAALGSQLDQLTQIFEALNRHLANSSSTDDTTKQSLDKATKRRLH